MDRGGAGEGTVVPARTLALIQAGAIRSFADLSGLQGEFGLHDR
jgi:hypothetical protein